MNIDFENESVTLMYKKELVYWIDDNRLAVQAYGRLATNSTTLQDALVAANKVKQYFP